MRNRMVKEKRIQIAILAVGLVALLLFTACARAPTGKTAEVAGVMPITGGAAASTQKVVTGIEDYFRYFNEQEAIPGVSIKFLWGDTSLQITQFLSQYQRFSSRGVPLIIAVENSAIMAVKKRLPEDGVVLLGSASGLENMLYSPGWIYAQAPTPAEQMAVVAEYFKENWREERPPRLAFVVMDAPWGRDPILEGTIFAQSLGCEVLPTEIVPIVCLDATTNLLRLKEEGADFVYLQTIAEGVGPILRDAERLELVGQMQFAGYGGTVGETLIEMAGAAAEGFLSSGWAPWFDETDNPGIKLMIDKQIEYHGKTDRDGMYTNGWIVAAVACESIKRAIENVGYDNLDGVAIKEGLDSMQDFDVNGLTSITYQDRPFDHRGITKLALFEVTGGKIVRLTDWREVPSLVPEGLVRE